ncbi:hypothetical protein MVEN_01656400 [Mycena venus]|uniref:Uncharacterized protein n=1 Tax=Mycena venus TaxID=2733690 RepID=A0A8H7CRL5_9AGAR|nr:hypothetical protein MVEN_01656400 [Mycena venus]
MDPTYSSTDVGSTDGARKKHFHGPAIENFPLGAFVRKLFGPPGKVIIGQLILQVAAWGFFATIWAKGFISISHFGLPEPIWYKPLGWAITLASTALSFVSSYLFSWGLRQAMTLDLQREGVSFDNFISKSKIAARSPILNLKERRERKQLDIMAASIAVFLLTGMQTSGWNSLLLPTVSTYDTDVRGSELNLANPLLQPMLASGEIGFCVTNSSELVALSVGQTGSGFAALNGDLDFPTSLTLMDNSFNTSTGGILPVAFRYANVSAWFPDATSIPAAITAPSIGLNNGLSWTWSILQQGFSADVHCELRNLTVDTTPSLSLNITGGADGSPPNIQMSSTCVAPEGPNPTSFLNSTVISSFVGDHQGYVVMIACGGETGESYQLILKGGGLYSFINTTVCTFTPEITTVWADYTYSYYSDNIAVQPPSSSIPNVGGPAGISAITTIYNMLVFAQGTNANAVGDQLTSILQDEDGDNRDLLDAIEIYLRGVAEYSGTILRACLSQANGTFHGGVPNNLSRSITGKLHTQFFGWEPTISVFWVLIPGTIVAGATIYIVLAAIARHAADPMPEDAFDPSDTMQLVSASAAGGLSSVFAGRRGNDTQAALNVSITFGEFEGMERALIIKHRNV